ncbi:Uncharacterized protein XB16_0723 [Leptospira santarosai]|uniref:Uncharacterized protein n=1 Tax=Leptospira santarosai TaxID=28183 RepID=A0A2P1QQ79_9LEPT|nr:Uncharacterized protein XB16_0723 [Leptospira santarosai]
MFILNSKRGSSYMARVKILPFYFKFKTWEFLQITSP